MTDQNGKVMESYSGGPVFKAVGSKGDTYTFNDFTIQGMSCGEDCIQFLDPETTEPYLYATYADASTYGEGYEGWWDNDDIGGTRLDGDNAETFSSGTAFLGLYTSGEDIKFNFNGAVEEGVKEIVLKTESPFICNPQPVDFTLANVKASGMACVEDCLQFLDPYTTEPYLYATYAEASTYGEGYAGWWDNDAVGETRIDNTVLQAGQGMLGLLTSGNEITLTFDAVLK